MKKGEKDERDRLIMRLDQIPFESNLGLLAYGDIAFTACRELKKAAKHSEDEKK